MLAELERERERVAKRLVDFLLDDRVSFYLNCTRIPMPSIEYALLNEKHGTVDQIPVDSIWKIVSAAESRFL